jgi:hypothetical protein
MKPTWTITAEQDDLPVRGNAICSGDEKYDQEVEDGINGRLLCGDVWAWASVKVECAVELNGEKFTGCSYLGACSYEDEEDFKTGGYYEQMKEDAKKDLIDSLWSSAKRGRQAKKILEEMS